MADLEKATDVNARGELTIDLGDGGELGLRPDHEAIVAIEAQLRPLRRLVVDANDMALTLVEQAVITTELMRGYGRAHPDDPRIATYREAQPKRIGELIHEVGSLKVCPRLLVVLAGALTGGYTASGEAKPKGKTA
ncbi:MAG TPA: hypothetical protein VN231_06075 [Allosphingosinicella sp.]|nr:hypothetical protein [Allosphingosinicella sp.]